MVAWKSKAIQVLVADSHKSVRTRLCRLLRKCPFIRVVGETSTCAEVVAKAWALRPDIVLLDLHFSGEAGIRACRDILERRPGTRVIFLISRSQPQEALVVAAFFTGAQGFLHKNMGSEDFLTAIRVVAEGQSIFDPMVADKLRNLMEEFSTSSAKSSLQSLTQRENKILALVAQGNTNKEIANSLNLSEKTVKKHLSSIYKQFKISRRSRAALLYQSLTTQTQTSPVE